MKGHNQRQKRKTPDEKTETLNTKRDCERDGKIRLTQLAYPTSEGGPEHAL